jgi:hypothetical protein
MGVDHWSMFLLRIRRAIEEGFGFGEGRDVNSLRYEFLQYLNAPDGLIVHPELSSLKLKIITTKSNHANISVSITPKFSNGWNNMRLLKSAGTPDSNGHKYSLKCRIGFSTHPLCLRKEKGSISLIFGDVSVGSWDKGLIVEKFKTQSKTVLCRFKYTDQGAWLLEGVNLVRLNVHATENRFEELIESKHISPEFRMFLGENHLHCLERGIPPGSVRDHGFGWRLKAHLTSDLYEIECLV